MKTYVRPMTAWWWRRNPFYRWYMLREASCVFITAYALVLLTGLARLAQGRAEFEAWRGSLATPGALVFHAVTLALVVYHAWTWFKVMPKTLPFVRLGGWRVPDRVIVATATGGAATASIAVFLAVWWLRP
jgi:fumarate reductase subunit C